MNSRDFDPFRLDVAAFAKAAGQLDGRWPLAPFDRLTESAVAAAGGLDAGVVSWSARGESRAMRGGESQVWLHLTAATSVPLECQRCLKPVDTALRLERSFLFVHGEDAAAQLDADSDDDVLALTRALDLRELIEDELLLALPIVPRHEVCPEPLVAAADLEIADEKPNPFAALAALKRTDLN
ncbi:MAG TPA: YceD family protein [Burkholderiaceae bacterium]|nr:YceD family protein [Burkholderiaceae bacterium]